MSERIIRENIVSNIFKYDYLKLGDVTIGQLIKNGFIDYSSKNNFNNRKPDGLFIYNKKVVGVVEWKKKLISNKINEIYKKQISYDFSNFLGATFSIIKDNKNIYTFNNLTRNKIDYSFPNFEDDHLKNNIDVEKAIDELLISLKENNDRIEKNKKLNPYNLSTKIWQKIWTATTKEPEKALYNVVELFIFKFLSDNEILTEDYSFKKIYKLSLKENNIAIKHYASIIRKEIISLFPPGDDGTTIINGTIFINEKGEPNFANATLFNTLIKDLYFYEISNGKFKNIDKNFKTKLYESFLRQTAGIKKMGQYFTPRKIVKNIIRMLGKINSNDSFLDPFCGVGGFPLEYMINEDSILNKYKKYMNNNIENNLPNIYGWDKGDNEKDSERTIILAKANMLIYLTDILTKYGKRKTKNISKILNKTFTLNKNTLGSLEKISNNKKYDVILTNPPYVTKGLEPIKKEIEKNNLDKYYWMNANGLEGMSINFILEKLSDNGRAIVILPDGLFWRKNDNEFRKNLLKHFKINAIIKLPQNAFYSTIKTTFILDITKNKKTNNIFVASSNSIGETLDTKRMNDKNDDLSTIVDEYIQWKINEKINLKKGKIINIKNFYLNKNYIDLTIDRFIKKKSNLILVNDYLKLINEKEKKLRKMKELILKRKELINSTNFITINLNSLDKNGNKKYIETNSISKEIGKKFIHKNKGKYPVYSAAAKKPLGHINQYDYDEELITWTTDGIYAGSVRYRNGKFSLTLGNGVIKIKNKTNLNYKYLGTILDFSNKAKGYDNKKCKLWIIDEFPINVDIPINKNNNLDYKKQNEIGEINIKIEKIKNDLYNKKNIFQKEIKFKN